MTTKRILAWADGHYKRTGRWPTKRSGTLDDAPELDWLSLDQFLEFGGLGLPGGSSLRLLLARHRGFERRRKATQLSIKLILVWADLHFQRTGKWPTGGSIPIGVSDDTWRRVDAALRKGLRGLEGGSSLAQLLQKRRGKPLMNFGVPLGVEQILEWADRHRERTGRWPNRDSGIIHDAPNEKWSAVNQNLMKGGRRLPGGTSLTKLLVGQRGAIIGGSGRPLTVKGILKWADAHRKRTGRWPTNTSGRIDDCTNESWLRIQSALVRGRRGLPGGSSLSKFLTQHRDKIANSLGPNLSVRLILEWADQHRAKTGRWPSNDSGAVENAPGERWSNITGALRVGRRGLPGGSSLADMLATHRGKRNQARLTRLTYKQILAWADAHRRHTGELPVRMSGDVIGAPGEKWSCIDPALRTGGRGLPGGTTLGELLARHRGFIRTRHRGVIYGGEARRLSVERILVWADEHHTRTGRWPTGKSGAVEDAPLERWVNVNAALYIGQRGLPGGSSLANMLATHRGMRHNRRLRRLTYKKILAWADAHQRHTGDWPELRCGDVIGTRGEQWTNINAALRTGVRGLPGGTTLAKLLAKHRGKRLIGAPRKASR